ncbi:hypothetical protein CASFOL_035176 [Castilleja foliolosa]|uniref:Uncharacterized protein n=1 Tax=Castilleja foliolosa TaxID=1961234 RepID=A0ABD3BSL5_9LAMI
MELSPMHDSPSRSFDAKAVISFYSKSIFNRLRSLFPISVSLLSYGTSKPRRRKTCLPLPLPSSATTASLDQGREILELWEDILDNAFQNLHNIQENLGFWESRAEGSSGQKAYFMLCERGPSAFIFGTLQLIHDFADGSSLQKLHCSASSYISERISVLTSLRNCMASFLAKVYMKADRFGEDLVKDPENLLPIMMVAVNDLFSELEVTIRRFHATCQSGSSVDGSYSLPLTFAKLQEVNRGDSSWFEITDAINLIYENLRRLDSYLTVLVFKNRKPRKVTLHWMRYSCWALGITVGSLWLLRHSRLMGSSDIDNWIRVAKDSTISFWNHHVEQPVLATRDELTETFKKREKGVMAHEEMRLTVDSLHRMLLALSEQAVGKKIPAGTTYQKMLEICMTRYEKEISQSIQEHMGGEFLCGLLILNQKLQMDIEELMLELDQILRANKKIISAILATFPTFLYSLVLAMLVPPWFKQDTRAEVNVRVARVRRRILLEGLQSAIMQFQYYKDQGVGWILGHEKMVKVDNLLEMENDAHCIYGLTLCFLDSLYCVVERHAKANGEWTSLKHYIVDLAKPSLKTEYKLKIASDMLLAYDCLLSVDKTPIISLFMKPSCIKCLRNHLASKICLPFE